MWFEFSVGTFIVAIALAAYLKSKGSAAESQEVEENVIVTYSKTIPGYEVKKIMGHVESSVVVPGEEDIYMSMAEQSAIQKLMDRARNIGANAILELKVDIQEDSLHTKIKVRGLAVRV